MLSFQSFHAVEAANICWHMIAIAIIALVQITQHFVSDRKQRKTTDYMLVGLQMRKNVILNDKLVQRWSSLQSTVDLQLPLSLTYNDRTISNRDVPGIWRDGIIITEAHQEVMHTRGSAAISHFTPIFSFSVNSKQSSMCHCQIDSLAHLCNCLVN